MRQQAIAIWDHPKGSITYALMNNKTTKLKPKKQAAAEPRDIQITRENFAQFAMNALIIRDKQLLSLSDEEKQLPIKIQVARAAWAMADAMIAEESWVPPVSQDL